MLSFLPVWFVENWMMLMVVYYLNQVKRMSDCLDFRPGDWLARVWFRRDCRRWVLNWHKLIVLKKTRLGHTTNGQLPMSMSLIFYVLSFVLPPLSIDMNAKPRSIAIDPISLEKFYIWPGVFASAMGYTCLILPLINMAIVKFLQPHATLGKVHPISIIEVSRIKAIPPASCHCIVFPMPCVWLSIGFQPYTKPMFQVVFPLTSIWLPIVPLKLPRPISLPFLKFPFVNTFMCCLHSKNLTIIVKLSFVDWITADINTHPVPHLIVSLSKIQCL